MAISPAGDWRTVSGIGGVGCAVRNLLACRSFVPDRPFNHGLFHCSRWGVGLVNEGSSFDGSFISFFDQTGATNRWPGNRSPMRAINKRQSIDRSPSGLAGNRLPTPMPELVAGTSPNR
jgi:hypothetical protein